VGPHWHDRIVYTIFYVPQKTATVPGTSGRRFGTNHAVVLSFILSHTRHTNPTDQLSINYISVLLQGINRKTVARVLQDLQAIGMIRFEQRGARLVVECLKLTDDHLAMFEPKLSTVLKHAKPETDTSVTHNDEHHADGFDLYRRLCRPVMDQSHTEKVVELARHLGLRLGAFEDELSAARRLHDQNMRNGKCAFPNFGKYLINRLDRRWRERVRLRREEENKRRREEYLASPEYAAAQAKKQKEAQADPLHSAHTPNTDSVLARVKFSEYPSQNRSLEYSLRMKLSRHVSSFISGKNLGLQQSIDVSSCLSDEILKQALHRVNHHYGKDTRATGDEFHAIINDELTAKGLRPLLVREPDRSQADKEDRLNENGARVIEDQDFLRELEEMGDSEIASPQKDYSL
jgi:hypothetical protein